MESYVIMHIYVQEGIVFKVFVDRGNVVKKINIHYWQCTKMGTLSGSAGIL
jgi:hypothetical protein